MHLRRFLPALLLPLLASGPFVVLSDAGAQTADPTAAAPAAPALRLDEGYTWFTLHDIEEPVSGTRTWMGYHVESTYRVYGRIPRGSAFLTIYKEGAREVGRTRCEGDAFDLSSYNPGETGMSATCDDNTQRIQTTTTLTAETYFVDGQTDAQTLLRTHTLHIQTAGNSAGRGSPVHFTPTHYVSRHQEILSAFLTWNPAMPNGSYGVDPYLPGAQTFANASNMHLVLSLSSDSDGAGRIEYARLRCTVDGAPVDLGSYDTVSPAGAERSDALAQSVPNPEGSGTSNSYMWFRQVEIALPFTFPSQVMTEATDMSAHPGRWSCDLRDNGTTVRTFAFTIGANGLPVPHAEQTAGLFIGMRAVLVDLTIPAGITTDQRSAPAEVAAGGFYGRPWTSPALRTAAAAVPAFGTPHLLVNPDGPATPAGRGAAPSGRGRTRGH